ncbi:hypothetical protein HYDPIDRAFT_185960, partial [Hydnomerulius pinastri MD-312]
MHQLFGVWDTAGLNQGTYGTVPAEKAEAYLKQLLCDLVQAGSIELLVYCVRGMRIRKKVPIVIVVTGLENQEESMKSWWQHNERDFASFGMRFDGHACVTTLEGIVNPSPTLERRLAESKVSVTNLITSKCRTQQWRAAERSWAEVFLDPRAVLSPKNDAHYANVIVPSRPHEGTDGGAERAIKRGADLLVFCVEINSPDVKQEWDHVHFTYGGDISPQIVVVVGASDQASADNWWTRAIRGTRTIDDATVTFWPTDQTADVKTRLRKLIYVRCIDCGKASIKGEQIFGRSLDTRDWRTSWTKSEASGEDVLLEKQDILTKWGIWDETDGALVPASPICERGMNDAAGGGNRSLFPSPKGSRYSGDGAK